ncbi:MAG: hypothetical protein P4L50_17575 [Anaerolineaceae bacterium]|nr:hypothetical protein [Anaerolineaceae bacterium]
MISTTILFTLIGIVAVFAIIYLVNSYKKVGYLFWKPFAPPAIKLNQIAPISPELKLLLEKITPSVSFGQKYFPCALRLEDGQEFSRVYIIDGNEHANRKGELPLDFFPDPIPIEKVVDIIDSPYRLPRQLAQALYNQEESSLGSYNFTVEFSSGAQFSYSMGGLVDFFDIPTGFNAGDAVRVIPNKALSNHHRMGVSYRWCIYRG